MTLPLWTPVAQRPAWNRPFVLQIQILGKQECCGSALPCPAWATGPGGSLAEGRDLWATAPTTLSQAHATALDAGVPEGWYMSPPGCRNEAPQTKWLK